MTITNWGWVYIRTEGECFTVGFYDPKGEWHSESDHASAEAASARVHYLNGGGEHAWPR